MVQAIINISEEANRILNMVKAKYDLRDKSEAINHITEQYGEELLEPQLRPEYVKKLQRIRKRGKYRTFKDIEELRKSIGHA